MKEIGGYLEMDTLNGDIFHKNAIALNSARHCLEYLLKAKGITRLYIPDFMCSTAAKICQKCKCQYVYYSIMYDFLPDFQYDLEETEYIYVVNYYGQLSNDTLMQIVNDYRNVIIDNVQAFFQPPLKEIDTIYSCRKFFGVSDGAYLYTTSRISHELERDLSYERIRFVLGRYERGAAAFFQEASANNAVFDYEPIKRMSKLTENILRGVSYNSIKEKREANFQLLNSYLKERNEITLTNPPGSFMYPFCIANGAQLRKKLIEKKIYVPCLWRDVFDTAQKNSAAWHFAENILPLPCDQRYGEKEMKYIVDQIME